MVDLKAIRRAKLRPIFDSMHGCGGRVLEKLAGGETIRAERDVLFGGVNPEPTERNLGALMKAVKSQHGSIGLATDGDADRLGVVMAAGDASDDIENFLDQFVKLIDVIVQPVG